MAAAQLLALREMSKSRFGNRVRAGVPFDAAALARLVSGRTPEAIFAPRARQEEIGGVRLATREAGRHRLPRIQLSLPKGLRH
jgi:hypothetical protein